MYKISKEISNKKLFKNTSNPKSCANKPYGCVGTSNGQGLPSVMVSLNILTKKYRESRNFWELAPKKGSSVTTI